MPLAPLSTLICDALEDRQAQNKRANHKQRLFSIITFVMLRQHHRKNGEMKLSAAAAVVLNLCDYFAGGGDTEKNKRVVATASGPQTRKIRARLSGVPPESTFVRRPAAAISRRFINTINHSCMDPMINGVAMVANKLKPTTDLRRRSLDRRTTHRPGVSKIMSR